MSEPLKTIRLVKGQQIFELSYGAGDEKAALDELVAMVNRKELDFSWFDAAVMSHQLGNHIATNLKEYLPKVK